MDQKIIQKIAFLWSSDLNEDRLLARELLTVTYPNEVYAELKEFRLWENTDPIFYYLSGPIKKELSKYYTGVYYFLEYEPKDFLQLKQKVEQL